MPRSSWAVPAAVALTAAAVLGIQSALNAKNATTPNSCSAGLLEGSCQSPRGLDDTGTGKASSGGLLGGMSLDRLTGLFGKCG